MINKTTRIIAAQLALSDVQQAIRLANVTSVYYVRATDIDGEENTAVFF